MTSIIFIACFIVFIAITETVKGWRLSHIQKISFSCIPLAILSFEFLTSKFGGLIVPMLAFMFWFSLGMVVLFFGPSVEKHQAKYRDKK